MAPQLTGPPAKSRCPAARAVERRAVQSHGFAGPAGLPRYIAARAAATEDAEQAFVVRLAVRRGAVGPCRSTARRWHATPETARAARPGGRDHRAPASGATRASSARGPSRRSRARRASRASRPSTRAQRARRTSRPSARERAAGRASAPGTCAGFRTARTTRKEAPRHRPRLARVRDREPRRRRARGAGVRAGPGGRGALLDLRARLDRLTGGALARRARRLHREPLSARRLSVRREPRRAERSARAVAELNPGGSACDRSLRPGFAAYARFESGPDLHLVALHLDSGQ